MTALPFAVDRYGRLLAPIDAGNPGNYPHAADGSDLSQDPPRGTASGVLPEKEEKGVPSWHALLSSPDPGSANMGLAHISPSPAKTPGPSTTDMLTQGEIARAQGFTGDCCIGCGGFSMRRNGTCLLCVDCGATTGCS